MKEERVKEEPKRKENWPINCNEKFGYWLGQ